MSKKGKPEPILAVGYLRKSTKGKKADGRRRQEKSLSQQRTEIERMARGRFKIIAWFEDDGISGSKRGAGRPDFQRMLEGVQVLEAQAVLCDNIDRFSRAAWDDVQEDAGKLRKAGVRHIVTASHGEYDLGARYDIGEILRFVVAVWSSCEYSRQLSRRVSLARRNLALENKRSGGPAPYGMQDADEDGKPIPKALRGTRKARLLIPGDPGHVQIVRWIFGQFVSECRSLNWIAGDLNKRKVPAPNGKLWYATTVKGVLVRKAYKGDFSFNENGHGKWFSIDGEGEVVESHSSNGRGKVFAKRGVYKAIVNPNLFDRAQRRLETLGKDRTQRKRVGYALTGVLFCDHCGRPMYGCRPSATRAIVYRCASPSHNGTCQNYQVREEDILPYILKRLAEEVTSLRELVSAPPEELAAPSRKREGHRREVERERAKLAKQIDAATDNILLVTDKRTRADMDHKLTGLRDRLEQLDVELADEPTTKGYTRAELDALNDWWRGYDERAVSMPDTVGGLLASFYRDPACDGAIDRTPGAEHRVLVDPRKVNQALVALGCEVRLRWDTENYTTDKGKRRSKYRLSRGRFRLGQKRGNLPKKVLDSTASRSTLGVW